MSALDAWLARQEAAHPHSIDLGLGRIAAAARALKLGKPAGRVITVAGTNGKGSTVAILEQLLRAAGLRTGTFTSPHLSRYNERIRIEGLEVSDEALIDAFERIEAARGTTSLTFFEYNALAAFLAIEGEHADAAVLEVGLGGRLDAVNLVDADAVVLCSIGLDHRDWLGETLEQIGAEKAGVLRRGVPTILATAAMPLSVHAAAHDAQAKLWIAGRDYYWAQGDAGAPDRWAWRGACSQLEDLARPALAGEVQLRNAAAALAALESLGLMTSLDPKRVSEALQSVELPGRFERRRDAFHVDWILDVAHNAPAAHELAVRLASLPRQRTIGVAGILADKDAAAITMAVRDCIDEWIFCTLPGPRGSSAADVAARARHAVAHAQQCESVTSGCARAREIAHAGDRVVVFGSFHTVGPAREFLQL